MNRRISALLDEPTKPVLTFINISHPEELKEQETINHVRCSAMSNFGRSRRGKAARRKQGVVFEIDVPRSPPMSRIGVDTIDPFDSTHLKWDAETTFLMTNSTLDFLLIILLVYDGHSRPNMRI
jgi:hypothetical protein